MKKHEFKFEIGTAENIDRDIGLAKDIEKVRVEYKTSQEALEQRRQDVIDALKSKASELHEVGKHEEIPIEKISQESVSLFLGYLEFFNGIDAKLTPLLGELRKMCEEADINLSLYDKLPKDYKDNTLRLPEIWRNQKKDSAGKIQNLEIFCFTVGSKMVDILIMVEGARNLLLGDINDKDKRAKEQAFSKIFTAQYVLRTLANALESFLNGLKNKTV